jgi:hypothetical protein
MSSNIWSRSDVQNILLAVFAARLPVVEAISTDRPPETEKTRFYYWGCRVAVQSLMLALGLPLQSLDPGTPSSLPVKPSGKGTTEHWYIEDLENVISAIYRSVMSTPVGGTDQVQLSYYRQGFADIIEAVLHAIGSEEDPQDWSEQSLDARRWDFSEEGSPKTIGSLSDEVELP